VSRNEREAFPFWRFSVRTYGLRGVAAACLALQDECGADVNLLLYCCWIGRDGRRLSGRMLRSAMSAVARWQADVIVPMRRARRAIDARPRGTDARRLKRLRAAIGAAELDAEYVEQILLARCATDVPVRAESCEPREAAHANVQAYLDRIGAPVARRHRRHVETLLRAAIPARPTTR
jgi:uncharacterized protein (TIGR02444 family)